MSRYGRYGGETKVYVGNLGTGAGKGELERAFSYYGPLRTVWIARNPPGFAFVEFEDPRDAEDAVRGLDGNRLDSECHEPYDIMLRRLANPTIKILLDLEIPIQVEIKIQVSFTTKKQPFKVQISISKKKEVREEVQVLKEWTEVLKFTF
ncbi:Serine/arginine-rich splicing factor 7 [Camelus dromedarius]|uniref:Serine/arginine-rich splicing factor 7 n=1 Tax=Camelus dromedarius TaxID=9838 RepID=A0A5N4D726_CAMDR|nr:Serine/arginine-rich splicing factor 7 [Camelus dromedarius]